MKKIFFAFLSFLYINVNAQTTQVSATLIAKLDSIIVVGIFPSPDQPDNSLQASIGLVHFELSNQYSKAINIPGNTNNTSIGCEVQVYSDSEKKYIDLKTPGDGFKEFEDAKLEILKPGETIKRKSEISFTTESNKKSRIRLVLLLSKIMRE
jgi:hypothetical protein